MPNTKLLSTLIASTIVLASAAARADDTTVAPADAPEARPAPTDPRAGDPAHDARQPGNVVLDDIFGFGFFPATTNGVGALAVTGGWFSYSAAKLDSPTGKYDLTSFSFAPSADVFVVGGLSLGGTIGIGRTKTTSTTQQAEGLPTSEYTQTTIRRSIAPRVGYAIPVTRDILVWPRAFFQLGSSSVDSETGVVGGSPPPTTSGDGSFWAVGADVQAVFVLSRHVLLGVGPRLTHAKETIDRDQLAKREELTASSTTFGVSGSLRLVF